MKSEIRSIALGVALVVALTGSTAFAEQKGGNHQAHAYAGSGKTAPLPQTKARVKPSKVSDSTDTNSALTASMLQNARQNKKDVQDDSRE